MQAILLAGGRGTRLHPITENIPKAMVRVNGKPMLEFILDQIKEVGVKEAVIVVHHLKEKIQDYFGEEHNGIKLHYAYQEETIGDANAISYAEPFITDDKFLLIACDNLFPTAHLHKLLKHKSDGVMSACEVEDARRFGVLILENEKVIKIIEKSPNPPTNLANVYVHYMPKEAFEAIKKIGPGVGGEYRFVDAIQIMINEGKSITYEKLNTWLDIGTKEQLEQAQKIAESLTCKPLS